MGRSRSLPKTTLPANGRTRSRDTGRGTPKEQSPGLFPLGAAPRPQVREVQGLPLVAKPPSLTPGAQPGGTGHPGSPTPGASLQLSSPGVPGRPTLKNARPCVPPDWVVFLWDDCSPWNSVSCASAEGRQQFRQNAAPSHAHPRASSQKQPAGLCGASPPPRPRSAASYPTPHQVPRWLLTAGGGPGGCSAEACHLILGLDIILLH